MNTQVLIEQAEAAEAAGFSAAAAKLKQKAERARKLAIAYEHFRFVKQEVVDAFNQELLTKTSRPATVADRQKLAESRVPNAYYTIKVSDQLTFVALNTYAGLPPADVLAKTTAARKLDCFDTFEVAEINPIATEVKLPDPIVFGRVEGCTDRFFVAEWGSDVSINDLLKSNEG